MSNELYILKVGGSLISGSNDPHKVNLKAINRIFNEIAGAGKSKRFDLIIGHGSGAIGHVPSKKYGVNLGSENERARTGSVITERACNRLNDVVVRAAFDLGIPVFSFSPHSFGITRGGVISDAYILPLKIAIKKGLVPVVYGDIFMDSENGFSDISTEEVIAALSKQLHPSKVIVFTDVDGVFDSDPKLNSKALMIPYIDRHNIREAIKYAGPSLKVDVTGGMRTKVISVYKAVRGSNTVGYILNGSKAGNVYRFLIGKKTRFTEIRW